MNKSPFVKSIRQAVGLLLPVSLVVQANAAITTFEDRATFELSVSSSTTEDFESYLADTPFHSSPVDVGDFTLSMTGFPSTDSNRNKIGLPPAAFPEFAGDGTNHVNFLLLAGDSLIFTFDQPISAFGADFAAFNDEIQRTQIIVAGETISPSVTPFNQDRFYGFTSTTPFTTVEFIRADGNEGAGIDNVTYGSAGGIIPEPSSAILLGLGAVMFGRRRRQ